MSDQSTKETGVAPSTQGPIYGIGEMPAQISAFPWEDTALGSIESWPGELIHSINQMLYMPSPCFIYWGTELTSFYNDASLPVLAGKHPRSLGQSAKETWKEVWHLIGGPLHSVLREGKVLEFKRVPLTLLRYGIPEPMFWDYTYMPIRRATGGILGILVTAQDVTATVHAQSELRDSELRADRVLQSIGDAVIVTDGSAAITSMNPVAEHLTQWHHSDARGKPLAEVFSILNEETRLTVESPAEKVLRSGRVVGLANHTVLIGKGGHETHIDDSAAPIRNEHDQLTGVVLVFRDIDERRKAERERERIAAQLKQILEAATDGMALLDRDWNFVYLNRVGQQVLAVGPEIVGQNAWEAFPAMIYDGSPYVYHYHRAMNEELSGDFVTDYPEPLNISVQVFARPVPDGILVVFRDITEQKRAAAALIQTEKLAAVGRLAASIAHEINNPLEAVTNLLYLARGSSDTTELHDYLDTAERELSRVSVISSQTLRFHKQSTAPREVGCSELFVSVLSIYQGRLEDAKVKVEKRKRANRSVACFEGEIRQVLNNLVGNALDAMHQHGGRLLLRSRESCNWRTGQKGVALTVADTGTGMPPAVIRKIFEAFYTTKGIGGTGLGLWVSKEIVDRHRGTLLVRSSQKEGHSGTVFSLFLPYDAASR